MSFIGLFIAIYSIFLDSRINPDLDYKSSVDKVVFMIIDALRLDFIDQRENFKYLNKLLSDQHACLVKLHVKSPTVTMPRIKALTSGTIPSFLDVVLNLGSSEMQIDNILNQLKVKKKNIVFSGDSTWMSMFPDTFERHYANQDSLFVNDFYEVNNFSIVLLDFITNHKLTSRGI